ncbi:MAG: hypothetical protein PHS73_03360 [Candidatus Peribacteraceae bacterium]|nr:hypothetical protein [Candidatus Peribacteraceae bacterium]
MTEQEPAAKVVPVQPWNIRIPEWIGEQTEGCRSALQQLWALRRKQIDLDRLDEVLPADIAETVRVKIQALALELGWEVRKVISMIHVYLPGVVGHSRPEGL